MDYTILKHESLVDMIDHVKHLVNKEGWTPLGSVSIGTEWHPVKMNGVTQYEPSHFYAQSMILLKPIPVAAPVTSSPIKVTPFHNGDHE